ncbi:TPA: hypothetical protein ACGX73_001628 [Listeria monocytogenes]|uniref:hypothetical protein n=1 Tax=Listeria monocytogenes TaxID=1639 RepID=UPI000766BB9D|nr:hypothetical protein [Listeria monocytogenes]CWU73231.1 Uncharacterised protein [Listeria monocytogenes]CWW11156.1 Uncharacterised protein [Listeria monocytogenes]HDI3477679.1 hypothetical protein [Listeria monocytogenes]
MTDNDPNIFKNTICDVCKKKVSTRLCDFVTEYEGVAFFRNSHDFRSQKIHDTCDLPMCDKCAAKYNGIYDFCPYHQKLLSKIKIPGRF